MSAAPVWPVDPATGKQIPLGKLPRELQLEISRAAAKRVAAKLEAAAPAIGAALATQDAIDRARFAAMVRELTPAMRRELRAIADRGEPSDPLDWQHAPDALWFHARDRVLSALLRRGLIEAGVDGFDLTPAGRAALAEVQS